MENFNQNPNYSYQGPKPTIPNAVAALVLGILSIVASCWFVGLVLGIVGLVLANKGRQYYMASPESYSGYGMMNAGRIMSIIGVCIGGLWVVIFLLYFAIVGSVASLVSMANMLD